MSRCWKNPAERADVETVCQPISQLLRQRVDTMDTLSDFDQKWNFLAGDRNLNRGSVADSESGSRLGLAGSFANSSSPSEVSVMSESAAKTVARDVHQTSELDLEAMHKTTPNVSSVKVQEPADALKIVDEKVKPSDKAVPQKLTVADEKVKFLRHLFFYCD